MNNSSSSSGRDARGGGRSAGGGIAYGSDWAVGAGLGKSGDSRRVRQSPGGLGARIARDAVNDNTDDSNY